MLEFPGSFSGHGVDEDSCRLADTRNRLDTSGPALASDGDAGGPLSCPSIAIAAAVLRSLGLQEQNIKTFGHVCDNRLKQCPLMETKARSFA